MDRITRSLVEEFTNDHGLESYPEDQKFEHLASFLAVGRHYAETFDTEDVVTGSGSDTGIDAVGIIVNGTLVTDPDTIEELSETNGFIDATFVFVQAERSASFETSKIGQFGFGVQDFFAERPSLPRNQSITDAAEIMSAVYAKSSKFKRGRPNIRLYYVTTGNWVGDANLEARRSAVVRDLEDTKLFTDVEFAPMGADLIQRLYLQSKNSISREFIFSERSVVPQTSGVSEAYIGLLPATEFLKLLTDDEGELLKGIFYDNVRDWQDYNPVNSEIKETITNNELRSRFALMNNGVTVIAKTLRATGNKFFIEDYQIVNGCQTSNVIYDQRAVVDDSVVIPLRLIATRDDDVIASVVKATNRQTEVREEQLIALSDFQKKLETYFSTFPDANKLYYERRSRQFNNVAGIEKTRIVAPNNLIRAYASIFQDEPHRTTRNFRSLYEKVGTSIFGPNHKLEPYFASALMLYRLEYSFRNQTIPPILKAARWHILLAARIMRRLGVLPQPNSNDMARYGQNLIDFFSDTQNAESTLVAASKVVSLVASGNYHRDHIRSQSFTENVIAELKRSGY